MGVAVPVAAQVQGPNDPSPLVLPGHRYDLPATLITAVQIEAHKKNMIAVKDDDVPMNMVKAGERGRTLAAMSLTVATQRLSGSQEARS